jgi:hypothetical protein
MKREGTHFTAAGNSDIALLALEYLLKNQKKKKIKKKKKKKKKKGKKSTGEYYRALNQLCKSFLRQFCNF